MKDSIVKGLGMGYFSAMALEYSSSLDLGSKAHPFSLPGVDGKTYTLEDFKGSQGLLIVFMCNHCPYVIAVHERLNQIAKDYASRGISVIGINSNDPLYKQEDDFEHMVETSKKWSLVFPYVFDESQAVAKAYDAACTPDPYLYEKVNGEFRLHYHGRIDDSWKDESKVKEQSLRLAIEKLISGQKFDRDPVPSMGCSIKWKELTAQKLAEKAALKNNIDGPVKMKSFRKFSLFTLCYTLLVIVWGAYVRATGSGAGCGDHWPLCNGEVIPRPESMKTWIEFAHRSSSGLNLILVLVGFFWAKKLSPKHSWIRTSAFYSVIAIFMEALLGAGLVLLKLVEFDQSVARAISISLHLVNTLFLITTLTALTWFSFHEFEGLKSVKKWFHRDRFFLFCTGIFLVLGMSGAITALGDTLFPALNLAQGLQQDLAHDSHFLVKLRVIHPFIAVIWILLAFVWSKRFERIETAGIRNLLLLGITLQFILGILNWVLMAPNWMQLVHLLVADLVFIVFWVSGLIDQREKGFA